MAYPILAPRDTWFTQGGSGIKRSTITEIRIRDSYTPAGPVTAQWDGSAAKDGSITVYVEGTTLTIAGNGSGKIQLSPDARMTFSGNGVNDIYTNVTVLNGLSMLDASAVTTAGGFFRYMVKMEEIDFSWFQATACSSFSFAFAGHPQIGSMALKKVIGIEKLNTASATDLSSMFYHCTQIQTLDIGSWDTGRCEDFSALLGECHSLKKPDIEGWNVSSGIYFSHMLCDNYELRGTLDLSGWNMAKAQDVSALINDCSNLEILNISGWNGTNIRAMAQMCERCRSLKRVIGLGKLKTPNASEINNPIFKYQSAFNEMFSGCSALEEVDLSSASAKRVSRIVNMFTGCQDLKKVTFGPEFALAVPNAEYKLPSPDPTYIPGADGLWYDASGTAYTPEDAVKNVPNTYYGSLELARKEPAMLENGTMIDIGQAIQDRSGSPDKHKPRAMAAAIRSIPSGGDGGKWKIFREEVIPDSGDVSVVEFALPSQKYKEAILTYRNGGATDGGAEPEMNIAVPFDGGGFAKSVFKKPYLYPDSCGWIKISDGMTTGTSEPGAKYWSQYVCGTASDVPNSNYIYHVSCSTKNPMKPKSVLTLYVKE